jgi:hypothetical protein
VGWTAVLAFFGGTIFAVLLFSLRDYLRPRRFQRPQPTGQQPEGVEDVEELLPSGPTNVVDAAFAQIEDDGNDTLQRHPDAFVFGLPPEPPKKPARPERTTEMNEGAQVIVEGHPCNLLSGVIPPNFKKNECQGICLASGQRGRPCFWASNAASQCPYFRPRVNPTRVKLRKTG